jgi:hypothetical protein
VEIISGEIFEYCEKDDRGDSVGWDVTFKVLDSVGMIELAACEGFADIMEGKLDGWPYAMFESDSARPRKLVAAESVVDAMEDGKEETEGRVDVTSEPSDFVRPTELVAGEGSNDDTEGAGRALDCCVEVTSGVPDATSPTEIAESLGRAVMMAVKMRNHQLLCCGCSKRRKEDEIGDAWFTATSSIGQVGQVGQDSM